MHGFTSNYIKVEIQTSEDIKDNQIAKVRLGDFTEDGTALHATLI